MNEFAASRITSHGNNCSVLNHSIVPLCWNNMLFSSLI